MTRVVLFKKEFTELWRTSKVLIVAIAFLFLGMSGPVSTKLLPELLKSVGSDNNFQIVLLSQMTAADAIVSYFNNMYQLPVLVLILIAMGTLAGEREKGTHILVLTKPVTRTQFILTKYFSYLALIAGGVFLTALGAGYYTLLLFNSFSVVDYLVLNLSMLAFMAFILALVIFCSSLFRTSVGAGGLSFLIFVVFSLGLNLLPNSDKFSPLAFLSKSKDIMVGKASLDTLLVPSLVGIALAVVTIALACFIAEKREM